MNDRRAIDVGASAMGADAERLSALLETAAEANAREFATRATPSLSAAAKKALLGGGRSRSKAVQRELRGEFLVSGADYAPALTVWGCVVRERLLAEGLARSAAARCDARAPRD